MCGVKRGCRKRRYQHPLEPWGTNQVGASTKAPDKQCIDQT